MGRFSATLNISHNITDGHLGGTSQKGIVLAFGHYSLAHAAHGPLLIRAPGTWPRLALSCILCVDNVQPLL